MPGASGLGREDIVQLGFGQQPALQHHFTHALTGFGTNLTDDVAVVVADERVEVGDDPDGVIDITFTNFFIRRDAVNAFFQQL